MEVETEVRSGCDADVDFGAGDPLLRALAQEWAEALQSPPQN